jgi:hypothetical protein
MQKAHHCGWILPIAMDGLKAFVTLKGQEEPNGAEKEARTLDLYLGKVSLYQLSYSHKEKPIAKMGSSNCWPGPESNHRHNDFQSKLRRASAPD